MASDRWRRISHVYHSALARNASERGAHLDQACEDDATLRREVDSLPANAGAADDFLAAPAFALAAHLPAEQPESLTGRRIGIYQILERIGAGGMGDVYRARDPKLQRDVAIKVLPNAFRADAERLVRFEREARMLASLNHSHLGAIYGVEEADGVPGLVLELVEGPTLADRIAAGAMPLDVALPIAKQIAEAVEAAHDAGVVHRDLKPANIKLRDDGTVKVLDFGLARALEPSTQDLSDRRTSVTDCTAPGQIMGTAAYMAPEQIRGEIVDTRADSWAFGCVLYEMLAGRPAFEASTRSDTIAAVLSKDPDWDALPHNTPAAIRRLLRRCLRKNRPERLVHMEAVRLEIQDAIEFPGSGTETQPAPKPGFHRSLAILAVSGALLGSVTTLVLWRPAIPASAVARSILTTTEPLYISSATPDVALSADGRNVAYVAGTNQLYVRAIGQLEPRLILRGSAGVPLNPIFSPDGEWVVFFDTSRSELMKVSIRGGPPVALCRYQGLPRGASWGPQGIVFATTDPGDGLFRVSPLGGDVER